MWGHDCRLSGRLRRPETVPITYGNIVCSSDDLEGDPAEVTMESRLFKH